MRRGIREVAGTVAVVATLAFFLLVAINIAYGQEDGQNQVEDWCETGIKVEPLDGPSYLVPEPPAGTIWTLLVIKSATDNEEFPFPVVGQTYTPSNGHDVSHVILCFAESEETTTTTSTTSTSSTTTSTTDPTETTTTTVPEETTSTTATTVPGETTTEPPPVGGPETGGGAMAASGSGWNWILGGLVFAFFSGLAWAFVASGKDGR